MAFCSSCGSALSEDARFCAKCGTPVLPDAGATGSPETASGTTEPPAGAASAQMPPVQVQYAQPANPNAGCGKALGIGCLAIVGGFILLIIILAAIGSLGNSASRTLDQAARELNTPSSKHHAKPAVPAKPRILLNVQGSGIKTTQRFEAPDEWAVAYSFDCSNFAQSGNFSVMVQGDVFDVIANALAPRGNDVSYVHSGGNVYLEINSECDWHVRAMAAP